MALSFVPFAAFVPDGGEHGSGLALVQNALPIHGGWRPWQQKAQLASIADGPVTGAWVHVFQQSAAIQKMRPAFSDVDAGHWQAEPNVGDQAYETMDEVTASDADFAFAPNAPAAKALYVALTPPAAAPAASAHFVRWRYRIPVTPTSAWTLTMELLDGPATVVATDTATGSAATAWVERLLTLSAGEIAAITSGGGYAGLQLRFTATVPGVAQFGRPESDEAVGSWTTQAGGATNLWGVLDETSASDADFIQSPALEPGAAAFTYRAALGAVADPLSVSGWTWRYRYRGRNAGVQVVARLKQGSTVIREETHSSIAATFTAAAHTLTTSELLAITDFAALETELVASYPASVASTVTQFARPDEDFDNSSGWRNTAGGTTNLFQGIDETSADDGTTFIQSDANVGGLTDSYYTAGLSAVADPLTSVGHIVRFRWKRASTGAADISVFLYDGANLIATVANVHNKSAVDSSWTTVEYTLTAAEADAISAAGYAGALALVFVQPGLFSSAASFFVTWAEMEAPEPRRAEVSWVELEAPSASRAEVSWAEMEVPDSTVVYRGDVPTIFAGTPTKLYTVDPAAWTDVSKGSGYAGAGTTPGAWDFCSFGNQVVATNFIDPVQLRLDNAGDFQDLITGTDKPKARCCAPFRNQLMLGGINFTGHAVDEIWLSDIDNIREFSAGSATSQPIVSCPGQIMRLVGGDVAYVFKRRSIHGIDWIGGQLLFRVRDVSPSVGTPYPRSVVSAGDGYIYFFDGSGFSRMSAVVGGAPEPIGSEVLSRFLTDTDFSAGAVAQVEPTSIADEEQLMVGWWDPHARLLFQEYQALGDSAYRHTRGLCYNPREDRWSAYLKAGQNLAFACTHPNVTTDETHLLKGTIGFDYNGTDSTWFKFSGGLTEGVTFRTKRQTIGLDEQGRPMATRVTGILPVFTVAAGATPPPITVTAYAAGDLHFLTGVDSETYTSADASEAGFLPHRVAGLWWYFEVTVPVLALKMMTAFKGLYLEHDVRGRA